MSERTGFVVDVVGASVANKVTGAGAVTGALGWLVDMNWIGLAGVGIALLGFAVNTYFQIRKDRREAAEKEERRVREAAESAARIAMYRERCDIAS